MSKILSSAEIQARALHRLANAGMGVKRCKWPTCFVTSANGVILEGYCSDHFQQAQDRELDQVVAEATMNMGDFS